ncbi:L-type lectin-domain containing receptor kinase VIII.1-like [Actinidia eriantha]|uniref:L-type lectin-domain containing receptor kinase VIII.1-like n=1 Tax=Actinidia eriantha TaxID=165200 RepID=UPI0025864601|nr:L-type lectin-domain containing receptor kinase VIII.1-like [Actinidia eriantha]
MSSDSGEFSGIIFVYFTLLLCFSGDIVGTTEFDFGTLTLSSLKLLGDAHLNNGSVRLTRDLAVPNSGAGRALYTKPIRFRKPETHYLASFSTFFSFSVTNLNPSSIGGGLAFVISPDDDTIGDAGGYLGLIDATGGPNGVVAVEFDTLMDVEFNDINGNHVGLDLNSMVSTQVSNLETIGIDLKSGDLVNSWIDYSGSTRVLNVSVSYSNLKPKEPLLSLSLDLDPYVSDFMFVGFSGSTQGSTEIHNIEWWSFTSSFDFNSKVETSPPSPPPPPTATLMNPTANSANPPPPSPPPTESNTTESHTSEKTSKCHNQLCKQGPGAVVGVVTAGAFFLALFAIILIWVYSKNFKSVKKSDSLASEIIKIPKEFSYKELKLASKCFNSTRIIGHGAFGTVYKGILPESGDIVAVKRCSHIGQGKTEFLSELSIIATLRHRNLVRLQGWCHEKGEILLVYDLMPNGSLDKALFESRLVLPWPHRRKILLGVASALAYLHQECENQVIHRDVKTSNIMLDEGFNARVGDFGLARQTEHDKSPDATVAAGTMGYLAPEYLLTGRATDKTDVFSYGAVVLEVASGRRPIEKETSTNLVEWVWGLHRDGRLLLAADSRLGGEFDEGEMRRLLLVGLACSHPDPLARPTMRAVVQMLVGEAEVPIVPRAKPSVSFSTSHLLLSLQDSVSDLNGMITISTSSSSSDHGFNGGIKLV